MNYKIKFSKEASTDLDNTFEYINRTIKAPKAAKDLMKEFEISINKLKEFPYMCPVCMDEALEKMGYRKLVVSNYVVMYSINSKLETIYIVRIFYGGRNYIKYI